MPREAINSFKRDINIKRKIEFHAVGFGKFADMEVLEKIANQMPNGKVSKAPTVKELTESFKRIVLGDYEKKID